MVRSAGLVVPCAASGVRAAWCCHHLGGGGLCGLAARFSLNLATPTNWYGSVGVPSGFPSFVHLRHNAPYITLRIAKIA